MPPLNLEKNKGTPAVLVNIEVPYLSLSFVHSSWRLEKVSQMRHILGNSTTETLSDDQV